MRFMLETTFDMPAAIDVCRGLFPRIETPRKARRQVSHRVKIAARSRHGLAILSARASTKYVSNVSTVTRVTRRADKAHSHARRRPR